MLGLIEQAIDASISTYHSNTSSHSSKDGISRLTASTSKLDCASNAASRNESDLETNHIFSSHDFPQRTPDNGSELLPESTSNIPTNFDKGKYPATSPFNIQPTSIAPTNFDSQNQEYSFLQGIGHPDDLEKDPDDLFSSQDFDSGMAVNLNTAHYFPSDGWGSELNWLAN
jgi:hypothetical protein